MRIGPSDAATQIELLRRRFARLARVECAVRSPLWAEVCTAIAGDDETLELVLCAPASQRRPTLLLAAMHDLLLAGTPHELAGHVPTVAAAGGAVTRGAGALALDFCRTHRDALATILATRSTQTNEVNRAAALLPGLIHATPAGEPLRLVELGASAGLNLLLDRFHYRYRERGVSHAPRLTREHTSPVICECAVEGELPALATPPIAERIGVDLDPVDIGDPASVRWLLACVWPDEADRVARLRAAIELARADPPTVVRGDALSLLPELVTNGRAAAHPVIWHSWVLAYWTPAQQRALAAAIDELGVRRDLTWLYLEQPSETPGLPTPAKSGLRHDPDDSALVAISYRDGARTTQRLAETDPHAHRMRWLTATRLAFPTRGW